MADGTLVEAGKIRKGDRVHTRDEDTMEWGDYEVTVAQTIMSERIRLVIGKTEFVCSPSHKFRDGNNWMTADQLRKGSRLEGLEIAEVSEETYGEVVKLTVDKAHTYICEGLLSHNKSEPQSSSSSSSSSSHTLTCMLATMSWATPSVSTKAVCEGLGGAWQGTDPNDPNATGPCGINLAACQKIGGSWAGDYNYPESFSSCGQVCGDTCSCGGSPPGTTISYGSPNVTCGDYLSQESCTENYGCGWC